MNVGGCLEGCGHGWVCCSGWPAAVGGEGLCLLPFHTRLISQRAQQNIQWAASCRKQAQPKRNNKQQSTSKMVGVAPASAGGSPGGRSPCSSSGRLMKRSRLRPGCTGCRIQGASRKGRLVVSRAGASYGPAARWWLPPAVAPAQAPLQASPTPPTSPFTHLPGRYHLGGRLDGWPAKCGLAVVGRAAAAEQRPRRCAV